MALVRILMVVILTLSASLSGAMGAGHMPDLNDDHTAAHLMEDTQPACCHDSTERAQTCHALPALLPAAETSGNVPAAGEDIFCASGMLLTGVEPSGSLDPPRAV